MNRTADHSKEKKIVLLQKEKDSALERYNDNQYEVSRPLTAFRRIKVRINTASDRPGYQFPVPKSLLDDEDQP